MFINNNIQSILIEQFDKADPYAKEEVIIASGAPNNINLSEILDRLIFSAGRFCQRYASDMFISWQYVLNTIKKLKTAIGTSWFPTEKLKAAKEAQKESENS